MENLNNAVATANDAEQVKCLDDLPKVTDDIRMSFTIFSVNMNGLFT